MAISEGFMDDLDGRIISALRHDARLPLSDLAAQLDTSRTTLRARIARLQERGDIVGFTVLTRADVMRDPVRGLMMIGIEGRGTERITRQLGSFPEIRAVHSTNGRWDIIVEIGTDTLEAFDAALTRIRRLDGIVASETNLLLKTRKAG
jgi:DNA-binding Lrp family transcriptional regulator